MAAFVTNRVSEERVEIHIFTLFLHNAYLGYRQKNKFKPDQEMGMDIINLNKKEDNNFKFPTFPGQYQELILKYFQF